MVVVVAVAEDEDELLRASSSFLRSRIKDVWMSFAMIVIVLMLRYVIVVTIISPPTKDHPRAMMILFQPAVLQWQCRDSSFNSDSA